MLKIIWRALLGLVVLLVLAAGALAWWAQDANRFKPELEALIAEQAGFPVSINGDLGWRFFPPLSLSANDVTAAPEGTELTLERLALQLDVMTILETRDVNRWRVETLTLTNLTMLEEDDRLDVSTLTLEAFETGKPAPVRTRLTYQPAGMAPIPLTLEGLVTYTEAPLTIRVDDAEFETDAAAGRCAVTFTPNAGGKPAPAARDEDLIPVDTFREWNWQGNCTLARLDLADQSFSSATVTLANDNALSETSAQIPEFFGGTATFALAIDARSTPVRWTLTPDLDGVDSQRLMVWLDQRLQWIAPVAYVGTLTAEGNTAAEVIASISGETRFDGGKGAISIAALKQPLVNLATLLNESERIARWEDPWNYDRLEGSWRIDKQRHVLDVALDNLIVQARGSYLPEQDAMDLLAELKFVKLPEGKAFDVNPYLLDVPIPVRCRGSLESPTCRLDQKAAERIVATALTSPEGSALRTKIDETIEKEVPEEYRDAARGLLDLLGGSLKKKNQDN